MFLISKSNKTLPFWIKFASARFAATASKERSQARPGCILQRLAPSCGLEFARGPVQAKEEREGEGEGAMGRMYEWKIWNSGSNPSQRSAT